MPTFIKNGQTREATRPRDIVRLKFDGWRLAPVATPPAPATAEASTPQQPTAPAAAANQAVPARKPRAPRKRVASAKETAAKPRPTRSRKTTK